MSDFDTVLERLLTDSGFTGALAADPDRALAGYDLTADERDLLRSQVSSDPGGNSGVEQRTSKAGLFGLLAPLEGLGSGMTTEWHSGLSPVSSGASGFGAGEAHAGFDAVEGGHAGFGAADDVPAGFGMADDAQAGFGMADDGQAGFGPADGGDAAFGPADGATAGFGPGDGGQAGFGPGTGGDGDLAFGAGGSTHAEFAAAQPAQEVGHPDYHTRVDVDGDGHWDEHSYRFREDGGVDVVADMDHDGRVDFVGHDRDADGRIDDADYDHDSDGRFETHWVDNDGDGWMDVRTVDPH